MEILQADIARYKNESKVGDEAEAEGLETGGDAVSQMQGEVTGLKDMKRKLTSDIYLKELILSRRRRQGGATSNGDNTAVQV